MGERVKLRRVQPKDVPTTRADPVDDDTLQKAGVIVDAIKNGGEKALIEYGVRFGDLQKASDDYLWDKKKLKASFDSLPVDQQELIVRTADRIKKFAIAQRDSISEMSIGVPGGKAGQLIAPVEVAGCYAPGGRYPLPSSVLMTACTAYAAGVKKVVLASPKPSPVTAAAAYVAGAESLLVVGGAQAIAAMAYGVGKIPACDVVVGPGNRWVTAAKKLVSGTIAIDMLAGPSELLVLADKSAVPATVAADLLAQAEHDTLALPVLVTTHSPLVAKVEAELTKQLSVLPTAETARVAVKRGYVVVCSSMEEAVDITNRVAPEHLELLVENAEEVAKLCNHYGGLFVGTHAAEVLGDYGAGPNHTLPTGGTARYTGGLSVFNFLRIRTWLNIDNLADASELVEDSVQLATLEGLIGHSRSAMCRRVGNNGTTSMEDDDTSPPQKRHKNGNSSTGGSSADPSRFLRPDFHKMMNYSPVQPLDILAAEIGMPIEQLSKLDANENLYGCLPEIFDEMKKCVMHIYPDPSQNYLRKAVSDHTGYPVDWCVAGAGSDELLDVVTRLIDPKKIIVASPTFAMYDFFARIQKSEVVDVKRGPPPSFALDVDGIIAEVRKGANLVFLASPNNPTGTTVSNEDVRRLCAEECVVCIDEAYAEFADTSAEKLVKEFSNLMVMHTFSKWAGLAGVRCGYVLAHPTFVKAMCQIKQPYNINVAADRAAIYSLENARRLMVAVNAMKLERSRLMTQLAQISFLKPLPSEANFIMVEVLGKDPRELQAMLRKKGVLVRCYAGGSQKSLDKFIRVSCGRPVDTDRCLSVLREMDTANAREAQSALLTQLSSKPMAVLWDMDGVLAEVSGSYRQAIIKTAAFYGVTIAGEDISRAKNEGNANNDWILTQRLVNAQRPKKASISLQQITDKFQEFYAGVNGKGGLRDTEKLIPSKAFLEACASKYPMAVVTGRPREECDYFLNLHGLSKLFKVCVCMEDGPAKPSPAPVLSALRQLGVSGSVVMIGDTPDDIRAAIAAKSDVIPIGFLPPAGETMNHNLAAALYEAGSAQVFFDMQQLAELLLDTPFHIYGSAAPSATPANAPSQVSLQLVSAMGHLYLRYFRADFIILPFKHHRTTYHRNDMQRLVELLQRLKSSVNCGWTAQENPISPLAWVS